MLRCCINSIPLWSCRSCKKVADTNKSEDIFLRGNSKMPISQVYWYKSVYWRHLCSSIEPWFKWIFDHVNHVILKWDFRSRFMQLKGEADGFGPRCCTGSYALTTSPVQVLECWVPGKKPKPWKDMEEKRAMCFQDCSLSKLSVKVLKWCCCWSILIHLEGCSDENSRPGLGHSGFQMLCLNRNL